MYKNVSKIIITIFILFFILDFLGLFFLTISPTAALSMSFEPQSDIGSFKRGSMVTITPNTIGDYIREIYKYAIGIVGILAAAVMMIGGIVYVTSGGRSDRVEDAKSWIKASLSGLILAVLSYSILYTVNPELIALRPLNIPLPGKTQQSSGGEVLDDGTVILPQGKVCQSYAVDNVLDYTTVKSTAPLSTRCDNYNYLFKQTFDPALVKAIAMQESHCDPSAVSPAGACGLMQLMPATAGQSCDWLKSHPVESVEIAARYLQSARVDNLYDRIAGYNGGYGTSAKSDGKLPPLAASNDCPGYKAYECCINPGGLDETQNYVERVLLFYNDIK